MTAETRAFASSLVRAAILIWFGLEACGWIPAPWTLDDWYWLPLGLVLVSTGLLMAFLAVRERALDRAEDRANG